MADTDGLQGRARKTRRFSLQKTYMAATYIPELPIFTFDRLCSEADFIGCPETLRRVNGFLRLFDPNGPCIPAKSRPSSKPPSAKLPNL